ncbi:MAG: hypothetical protein WBH44_10880 [Proteocatella sp.]
MKQRILVIKEVLGERNELAFALVEPYIKDRLEEGCFVNVHETDHKDLKSLFEEDDLWHGEITQEEINLMFDINTYDKVVYIPQDAVKPSDILIYDPEKLDKNMIFYHIGNMDIRESSIKRSDEVLVDSGSHVVKTGNDNKVLWLMVSFIPWLVFILMNLLGYSNISAIPLMITVIALILKKISKNRYLDFVAEFSNVGFFLLILVSNYSNSSWMANICIPLTVMGMTLMLIMSLVGWEEA